MEQGTPYPKTGPDAEFIGAGDDVVVIDDTGRSIEAEGILVDAPEGRPAIVNVDGDWREYEFSRIAHPDSPQVEAIAMFGDQPDLFSDERLTPAQAKEIEAMEVLAEESWRDGDDIVCRDANGHLMALRPDGTWVSETDPDSQ